MAQWRAGRRMALLYSIAQATILSRALGLYRSYGVPDDAVAAFYRITWDCIYMWPVFFAISAFIAYRVAQRWYPRQSDYRPNRQMGVCANWFLQANHDA